jgi:hypothetical protein
MSIAATFVLIIVLIVLVIVGISLYNKTKGTNNGFVDATPPITTQQQQQSNLKYNSYLPVPSWGDFIPSSSPSGQCLNYSISAAQFTPEFPSFNGLNSGAGRGYIATNQTCLDVDQIFAQAGSHTCQYNNAGSAASGCILTVPTLVNGVLKYPGTIVPRGTTEGFSNSSGTGSYFVPCNYGNFSTTTIPSADNGTSACGGSIGLISPNFTPIKNLTQSNSLCSDPTSTMFNQCIALSDARTAGVTYNVELRECSLGDFEQIFRVTRYEIDDTFTLTQNDQGRFASIVYRENGFYLAPDLFQDPVSGAYQFDLLNKDFTTSLQQGQDTVQLKLINPANDPTRNGIYWFFQNQLTDPAYDPVSIPPQQYYGCNIYGVDQTTPKGKCSLEGIPSFYQPDYIVSGLATSYTGSAPISPQQFVYIPDVYQFPTSEIDLSGLWSYLENQFSLNMITLPDSSVIPVLQKFRKNTLVTVEFTPCTGIIINPSLIPNPTYPPGPPFITNPGTCVKSYSNGDFPIQNEFEYKDTQFLSYLNIQRDMVTGISSISPGCLQQETNFVSNIYNPIVSANSNLLGTSPPLSQQTS